MSNSSSYDDRYDRQNASRDGYDSRPPPYDSQHRSRSVDNDTYEPPQYGSGRSYAARDGYARDQTSDQYEQRQSGGSRGYVPAISYRGNDERRRSFDGNDRRRSYNDDDDDEEEEDDRRRPQRARSQHSQKSRKGRRNSSSSSRGGDENTPAKKWGATLAGAAIGGFTAHKAKGQKGGENWVPAAIGAVIGGLVGREVEKGVYKRKEHKREEEETY